MSLKKIIQDLNPYAFYTLDDTDTIARDRSGHDRDGFYLNFEENDHNSTEIKSGLPPAPTFAPPLNTHIKTGVSKNLKTGTAIIVLRPQAQSGRGTILGKHELSAGSKSAFPVFIDAVGGTSTDKLGLHLSSGNNYSTDVDLTIETEKNRLNLITGHWSATESFFEVYGLPRQVGAGCELSDYSAPFTIGRPSSERGGNFGVARFSGQIGYVAIFERKLTDLEIVSIQEAFRDSALNNQSSKISGLVKVNQINSERTVRAFSYNSEAHQIDGDRVNLSKSLGHSKSDATNGNYTIELMGGYDQPVFVVAFDDYGVRFERDLTMTVGQRVHPTVPNGFVWECTSSGALPSTEPEWVIDLETSKAYGTASLIARNFYQPECIGPVIPKVTES